VSGPAVAESTSRIRAVSANAADFDATERNAATSAAAPSNTSGHQKWNGTADSLNASPIRMNSVPRTSKASTPPVVAWFFSTAAYAVARSGRYAVPNRPAKRLMP
jgi:hypothetical protein